MLPWQIDSAEPEIDGCLADLYLPGTRAGRGFNRRIAGRQLNPGAGATYRGNCLLPGYVN